MFLKKLFFSFLICMILTIDYSCAISVISSTFNEKIPGAVYYKIHGPTYCTLWMPGSRRSTDANQCPDSESIVHQKITIAYYNSKNQNIAIANHENIQKIDTNQLHIYAKRFLDDKTSISCDITHDITHETHQAPSLHYDVLFFDEYVSQDCSCMLF